MNNKLLILDGISGISLGQEIAEAFHNLQIPTEYIASAKLSRKKFFKPATAIKKVFHKKILGADYYRNPKITNSSLIKLIEKTQPETIFVIGFLYRFFDLDLIAKLKKKHGFKLYLYDTDSCNLFSYQRELIYFFNQELPLYDHIYSFSKTTTQFINKLDGLNATHFPYGAKPIAVKSMQQEHDVLFVGSADMRRIYLLEQLTQFKLSVYGSRWQRYQSLISSPLNTAINPNPVWGSELHELLFKSKIILNVTRSSFYGVETGINLRIFETLAAQGFLLTDHTPELEELFLIGEEIETYSCSDELTDKVRYYLKNEDKRYKIAQKGHAKFVQTYSWDERIKELSHDPKFS